MLRDDVADRHVHVPINLRVQEANHFWLLQHVLWQFTFVPEVHSISQVRLHLVLSGLIRHFIDEREGIQNYVVLSLSKLRDIFNEWFTLSLDALDLLAMNIFLEAFECLALVCILRSVALLGHL